jgi:pimeloyl-ACP methyl ester carboxylesterase
MSMVLPTSVPLRRAAADDRGTVVLVHGLSSAARSWSGFVAALPDDVGYVAADLPGHGHAPAGPLSSRPYSFGAMATGIGALCASVADDGPVTVIGHSLGGAVALLVGSGLFGASVEKVVAIDSKVRWAQNELDRANAVAAKPPKLFATRDEALRFWQLVAGVPVGEPVSPALETDVLLAEDDGWRLAYDPSTAALGAAPIQALIDLSAAPVQLVRGELDPMVSADEAELPGALPLITVAGCGHSPHVERPAELVALLGL